MSDAMHLPVPGRDPRDTPGVEVKACPMFWLSVRTHSAFTRAVEAGKDAWASGDRAGLLRARADIIEAEHGFHPCIRTGEHDTHRDAMGHEWGDDDDDE